MKEIYTHISTFPVCATNETPDSFRSCSRVFFLYSTAISVAVHQIYSSLSPRNFSKASSMSPQSLRAQTKRDTAHATLIFPLPYVFFIHPAQARDFELAFSYRYTIVRSILRNVRLTSCMR